MRPELKQVARFVRDLLVYDEQLIKFDRENIPESDFTTSYIVVNGSSIANKTSTGNTYDGDNEIMRYNDVYQQAIILEFYGDDAYTNASKFSLLNRSQLAYDLKRVLGISISHIKSSTDVKQILGNDYGNRVHLEFTVDYCSSIDVETLRIDEAQFSYLEDL